MPPKNTVVNDGSRAKFIRAHAHLDATSLVKKASEKGIKLTTNYVYNLRSTDKKKRLALAKTLKSPSGPVVSDAEAQLRVLVLRIGLDRLKKIVSELDKFLPKDSK